MANKINITNMDSGHVVIISEDMKFRRDLAPGRTIPVPEDVFEELTFDEGFQNFVAKGFIKVEGIEENTGIVNTPEGETGITVQEVKKMIEDKEIAKLKKMLPKATAVTKNVIAQCAIEMNVTDEAFCAAIKKYCNIDVIQAITMKRQAEE